MKKQGIFTDVELISSQLLANRFWSDKFRWVITDAEKLKYPIVDWIFYRYRYIRFHLVETLPANILQQTRYAWLNTCDWGLCQIKQPIFSGCFIEKAIKLAFESLAFKVYKMDDLKHVKNACSLTWQEWPSTQPLGIRS